jgi:hypothetical protein
MTIENRVVPGGVASFGTDVAATDEVACGGGGAGGAALFFSSQPEDRTTKHNGTIPFIMSSHSGGGAGYIFTARILHPSHQAAEGSSDWMQFRQD